MSPAPLHAVPPPDSEVLIAESSGDFITDFLAWTGDDSSPELFRKWTAISMVAAALERRVWVRTGPKVTFPNLYTLLVGAPGAGKSIIDKAKGLMRKVKLAGAKGPAFHVAPDFMTPAGLIDTMEECKKTWLPPRGEPYHYSPLYVLAEEFSVLMPTYDMAFVGALNGIWNNPVDHAGRTRHGKPPKHNIEYPTLNLIGGVQPAFISSTFPEETWTTGLGRRCFMVYCGDSQPIRDPFAITEGISFLEDSILTSLTKLADWFGPIDWTAEAKGEFQHWWLSGGGPVPTHSKLIAYNQNRAMNIMKLAGISVASQASPSKTILPIDFQRARAWMLEIEALMPDIFRAMLGKSDYQVMEELHIYLVAKWQATGQKSVSKALAMAFLAGIVPGNKAVEIMMLAEQAGFIRRDPTKIDYFFPAPKITRSPE